MPTMLGKLREAVLAISIGAFSHDAGQNSDLSDVERELVADTATEVSVDGVAEISVDGVAEVSVDGADVSKAIDVIVEKQSEDVDPHFEEEVNVAPVVLDLSVNNLLRENEKECSRLSSSFQATYCLEPKNNYKFQDDQNFLNIKHNYNTSDNARFKAFDCGDVKFTGPRETSLDKPVDAWRCLGNFNIIGGKNWSIKGSASVKQDMSDISNSSRFGVCPEGDMDCVGFGLELRIEN